ncbi:MAG: hypothetical protein AABZ10_04305 [Nitrospirota bacterium]
MESFYFKTLVYFYNKDWCLSRGNITKSNFLSEQRGPYLAIVAISEAIPGRINNMPETGVIYWKE